jgi:protein gp37
MQKEWALSLRDQCSAAKIPFYFKQWGGFPKGKYGSELDGEHYKDSPPFHFVVPASLEKRRVMEAALQASFSH